MILEMSKVRILGPRAELEPVLRAVQDLELLHLGRAADTGVTARATPPAEARENKAIERILSDVEKVLAAAGPAVPAQGPDRVLVWAREARRLRRKLEAAEAEVAELESERAMLRRYEHLLAAFTPVLATERKGFAAYQLILEPSRTGELSRLEAALGTLLGDAFSLVQVPLDDAVALLLFVPHGRAGEVERLLAQAHVSELPMPEAYGGRSLAAAVPMMQARLSAIPGELAEVRASMAEMAGRAAPEMLRARAYLFDRKARLDALAETAETAHAFVIVGWVPKAGLSRLSAKLELLFGGRVTVEGLETAAWEEADVPVVLSNPAFLKPFETIVEMLPLPRYGTVDPTPFVAAFFPTLFGMILGDVGYGTLLVIVAALLLRAGAPGSRKKSAGAIALACGLASILFGVLFGELFGDLGRRWFGMEHVLCDREEALLPVLGLALAIGAVHVLLGLVIGAVAKVRREPRAAVGKGLSAVLVVLIALAIGSVAEVLPRALYTPVVIAVLVAFPVLVILEGFVAPFELLATFGNILSYARVMAIGTASVMLAVVANRMVGAMGGAVVGVLFGLLFHLVNFALGLFSSTIHALRLHYVEFFGKFYDPGGARYRPLGHWRPGPAVPAQRRRPWMRASGPS